MTASQTPEILRPPLVWRVAAGLVDLLIWAVLGGGLSAVVIAQSGTIGGRRAFVAYVTVFVTGWLYFAFLEASSRRGSIGKQLFGLAVTDLRGRRISFGRATLRHWGRTISALPLFGGFVVAAFNERQQAFHDWVADCCVVPSGAAAAVARPAAAAGAAPAAPAPAPAVPAAAPAVPLVVAPSTGPAAPSPVSAPSPASAGGVGDATLRDAALEKTVLVGAQKGWRLAVLAGPDVGREFLLGVEARIGRDPSCAIHLNDETASRSHALIVQTPAGFVIRDLDSANGTLVGGTAITEPRSLQPGETITIGSTQLTLKSAEAA